jgi:hypothetical protein
MALNTINLNPQGIKRVEPYQDLLYIPCAHVEFTQSEGELKICEALSIF